MEANMKRESGRRAKNLVLDQSRVLIIMQPHPFVLLLNGYSFSGCAIPT
jgi:hypothetical protein